MIEITYMKSESGLDNCFELMFPVKQYIDSTFYENYENEYAVELFFYIALFLKYGIFDGQRKHCHQSIWSYRYDCFYKGIPFFMIFDEDYDMVTFSVNKEDATYRKDIAEHIKCLIELKEPLEKVEIENYMW